MKPLLLVLLAASLVANVFLVVQSRRSAESGSPASSSARSAPAGGPAAAVANPGTAAPAASSEPAAKPGAIPHAWRAIGSDQELPGLVASLRAAGFPASVIRAIINQLLNERFAARQPNAGQPFWKRSQPTPESMAAQTALNNERQALFESLLGPDARPSAQLDARARAWRYGNLPDEKIDAIAKIERDYQEISAETWARRRGNAMTNAESLMQSQQLMEKEKQADLAALLSPDELAQYDMRNSNSANRLINNVRNIDLTEAEYVQLYQAQKAFDGANPMRAVMDSTTMAQRQLAQQALNEQARSILGDARFFSYLEGADGVYAMVAQTLAKYPGVAPATAYQVYQLQTELQAQMSQSARGGQMGADQMEAMRSNVAAANAKLEAALGPEIAEAYRSQGMGRMFTSFRNAPRPLVPASK